MPKLVEITIDDKKAETPDAVLFVVDGNDFWIPRSQIDDYDDSSIVITEWWAVKEGLDPYAEEI